MPRRRDRQGARGRGLGARPHGSPVSTGDIFGKDSFFLELQDHGHRRSSAA
ncbi:MAG: hypothetical protein WKF78_01635 [Candidatus Limnocylindrales bacterium]